MSFKEKVKAILEDKLKDGTKGLLESINEIAADSGLTESEQTVVASAISKYADSANSKILESIADAADTEVTAMSESFESEKTQIKEASEGYAKYIKEGADSYAEYVQTELKEHYETYTNDVVVPNLSETLDSYIAIMATKLDEEGANAINVLKATKYNQIVESFGQLGFNIKPLVESEEELTELQALQAKLDEANTEIKALGKKLNETSTQSKTKDAEKFVNEAVGGLSELQADKVRKLASRLDEKSDTFQELVTDLVEAVKNKASTTTIVEDINTDPNKKQYSHMDRYVSAASNRNTRL